MRYYKALQRGSDGKWDYTCSHRDHTYAIGYCHEYKPFVENSLFPNAEDLNKEELPFIDKYHINGHETASEAEECYKQYLLDHNLRTGIVNQSVQEKCKVCAEWTQLCAIVDDNYFVLCEKHNNREEVEKLFKAPSEIWAS